MNDFQRATFSSPLNVGQNTPVGVTKKTLMLQPFFSLPMHMGYYNLIMSVSENNHAECGKPSIMEGAHCSSFYPYMLN